MQPGCKAIGMLVCKISSVQPLSAMARMCWQLPSVTSAARDDGVGS
jgi:hypothetical protein